MADQKISQLADAGAPQDTDQLLTARSGTTLSLLWSSVKTALNSLYVPLARTVTAGTGLTGGGDLSANRSFAVSYGTSSTTACVGNDSRLSDSRTPTAHESTHEANGSDALPWTTIHGKGTHAARPVAGATNSGYVYWETDTSKLYRSDGSTWLLIGSLNYTDISGTPSALPPNGSAGGDLTGTYPNPTIADVSLLTTKGDILIRDTSAPAKRLAIGSTGQLLGIASGLPAWAYPPGYEINYTQITSPVNITATSESAGTTILSPGAITFDGGPVICEFVGNATGPSGTSCSITICLFESATEIGRLATSFISSSSGNNQTEITVCGRYRFTPSAASHTYTVTGFVSSTTGTPKIDAGAAGTAGMPPAFVRFVKV